MKDELQEKIKSELTVILDMFSIFMPAQVNLESRKDMAMYEAFHRLKNLNDKLITP